MGFPRFMRKRIPFYADLFLKKRDKGSIRPNGKK
jgi:hypothetical protein